MYILVGFNGRQRQPNGCGVGGHGAERRRDGAGHNARPGFALERPEPAHIPNSLLSPTAAGFETPLSFFLSYDPLTGDERPREPGAMACRDSPLITGSTRRSTSGSESTHGTSRLTPSSTHPSDQQGQDLSVDAQSSFEILQFR